MTLSTDGRIFSFYYGEHGEYGFAWFIYDVWENAEKPIKLLLEMTSYDKFALEDCYFTPDNELVMNSNYDLGSDDEEWEEELMEMQADPPYYYISNHFATWF